MAAYASWPSRRVSTQRKRHRHGKARASRARKCKRILRVLAIWQPRSPTDRIETPSKPYQDPSDLGPPWSSSSSQVQAKALTGLLKGLQRGEELIHGWRLGDISELLSISRPKAKQRLGDAQKRFRRRRVRWQRRFSLGPRAEVA